MKRFISICFIVLLTVTSFNTSTFAVETDKLSNAHTTSSSITHMKEEKEMNFTQEKTIIDMTDYGVEPNSGKDAGPAVQKALVAAKKIEGPVLLNFPNGQYDFFPEGAVNEPYYISNTASETQNPDVTKSIGILLKGMEEVTLEGNDSLFLFHGEMTSIVVDESEAVQFKNVNIDYARPTTSEMEVIEVGDDFLVAEIHEDSLYKIEQGKIIWTSELNEKGKPYWTFTDGNAQVYDPIEDTMRRTWNPGSSAKNVAEIKPSLLKFAYHNKPDAKVGEVFTMRADVRNQVGIFIQKSKDIVLEKVGMHYMHGLGVVFQHSENLTIDTVQFAPRKETKRVTAGFADFLQVSAGRGLIKVVNSHFSGPNDDPINVHGTHLRVTEKLADNQIVLRFMHHQTYGFDAFFPGDEIDFIHANTLTAYGNAKVTEIEKRDNREIVLTLDQSIPEAFEINDVIENVTWTPEVEIRGNHFERVPTRGILITTRKKVVIEENIFLRPQMSAILIASDAENWYESGMVQDVTIRGNEFIESGNPVIYIHPENRVIDWENPVHQNITIEDNIFQMKDNLDIDIKSTRGFQFINNSIIANRVKMNFTGSSEVEIAGNKFEVKNAQKTIQLKNSFGKSFNIDENQGFTIIDDDELKSASLTSSLFELDRSNMTATATSYQALPYANSPDKVLDGDENSIWHSEWDPYAKLPQSITIDLKDVYTINQLNYLPRQDGPPINGNIKAYNIYTSIDGKEFLKVAQGQWENTPTRKAALFTPQKAAYIKLEAIEGHGGWASASEITIDQVGVISPGDRIPLTLNVQKMNGQAQDLADLEIVYSSDNPTVATVNAEGVVTAIGSGKANIKVKVIKDERHVEDFFPITVTATEVSAQQLKSIIVSLAEQGELSNEEATRSLTLHLTAVAQYEQDAVVEKIVKHLNRFKKLLEHQKENQLLTEQIYHQLIEETDLIIDKWT